MKGLEIFFKKNKLSFNDWQELLEATFKYEKSILIEIIFKTGRMEFFLYSGKDLSVLAVKSKGFILKPTKRQLFSKTINLPKKIAFKLPLKKSILEIKEKEEIKKQRFLQAIIINPKKILNLVFYTLTIYFKDTQGNYLYSSYTMIANPFSCLEIDFKDNPKMEKKSVPLFLNTDEVSRFFTNQKKDSFLEAFGFPHISTPVFFPLKNFDFTKHTLIVGQTGVGKSKLIELLVKNIAREKGENDYAIIIIDPHSQLYPQFLDLEASRINFDFARSSCELFPGLSEPKIATELTVLLFKTLLGDQFNAKTERVLKYVFFVLFLTNKLSLLTLKRFLTEIEFRSEILKTINGEYDYLIHFFETEFVELQTKFYEIAVMPILVLIDELSFIPALSKKSENNLENILNHNFLTCFSLNRILLGEKATRLIAGLIIQQIFLIAQKKSVNKKLILIIDEISLVENKALINILSEARKFNLSLFASQQYLTQITPDLLKGILSNVFNYFVFKVSDEDAKILIKNLEISFPDEFLKEEKSKGFSDEDLKRKLLVTLNPRECLVRIFSQDKFYPCFKAKTLEAVENKTSKIIYERPTN